MFGRLASQLTFDGVVFVEQGRDPGQFVFVELTGGSLGSTPALCTTRGRFVPDTVRYCKEMAVRLVVGNVDAHQTRHVTLSPAEAALPTERCEWLLETRNSET